MVDDADLANVEHDSCRAPRCPAINSVPHPRLSGGRLHGSLEYCSPMRQIAVVVVLLSVLACSHPPSVSPRQCPGLPDQMLEGEIVRVTASYVDVPNALSSITSSVTQAGGHAEYELFDGWFAAEVDKTTAGVLCRHGLIRNVVEDLPAAPY